MPTPRNGRFTRMTEAPAESRCRDEVRAVYGEKLSGCVPPQAIEVKVKERRILEFLEIPVCWLQAGLIGHLRKAPSLPRTPSTRIWGCENANRRTPSHPVRKKRP